MGKRDSCRRELERFLRRYYPDAREAHKEPHDAGWRSLCRAVFQAQAVCDRRLQQIGDDILHGCGNTFNRFYSWTEHPICNCILPSNDLPPPVGGKRAGIRLETSNSYFSVLPPYGLGLEAQLRGTQLELSLQEIFTHLPHSRFLSLI